MKEKKTKQSCISKAVDNINEYSGLGSRYLPVPECGALEANLKPFLLIAQLLEMLLFKSLEADLGIHTTR